MIILNEESYFIVFDKTEREVSWDIQQEHTQEQVFPITVIEASHMLKSLGSNAEAHSIVQFHGTMQKSITATHLIAKWFFESHNNSCCYQMLD